MTGFKFKRKSKPMIPGSLSSPKQKVRIITTLLDGTEIIKELGGDVECRRTNS